VGITQVGPGTVDGVGTGVAESVGTGVGATTAVSGIGVGGKDVAVGGDGMVGVGDGTGLGVEFAAQARRTGVIAEIAHPDSACRRVSRRSIVLYSTRIDCLPVYRRRVSPGGLEHQKP
jgi:hypothetical protein